VGATEAGFFPAVIYYLTLFVAEEDMGLCYTIVMTATALSGIVGGPIAGLVMTYMAGVMGLDGWRWLFVAEAVPTVVLGLWMLCYLDGEPASARFLDPAERDWLVDRHRRQAEDRDGANAVGGLGAAVRMRWLWVVIGIWLLYSCGYYGIIFWMPLLLKSLGHSSNVAIGFLSSVPYACAAVAMIAVARSSDASRERRLHLALAALSSAAGFFGAVMTHVLFGKVLAPLLFCLCISTAGIYSMFGPYWGIPTAVLSGETAAAGFALINSVGVVGGFVGPWLVGHLTQKTGNYDAALAVFGAMMVASGILALSLDPKIGANGAGPERAPVSRRAVAEEPLRGPERPDPVGRTAGIRAVD
jgi:MFS transporter, ACS family, tartrate transporter